ncbi:MAG: hypothetical protein EOP24_14905 [Hyphomicrobiales bacterium]|nr:MAG: hypothetical protein EOP24_14905 [Hyphomicrobiales bacterium]
MRLKVALLAGINAVLLGTTAASAADLDQLVIEEPGNPWVVTIGAGVAGYALPGVVGSYLEVDGSQVELESDGLALGGLVGVSASTQLGEKDGTVSSLGISGFMSFATRSSSSTIALGNDSSLFIPGITTPTGTITLTTDPAGPTAAAGVSGTADMNQVATILSNPAGASNGYGVDPAAAGDGFSYVGIATLAGAPNLAYAFGAIADETGGVFLAVGDLEGWLVSTDVSHDIVYTGGDVTFALTKAPEAGEPTITGYAGPSYRFLGQGIATEISVDAAELQPTAPANFAYPLYTQTTDETLDSHYVGGIVGGNITMPVAETASLTLGLEGGAYFMGTSYDVRETYAVSGGVPSPVDHSVENAIEMGDDSGFAYAVRTQANYTTAIGEAMQLSFGVGGEYLSRVASIGRDPAAIASAFPDPVAGDDATYVGPNDNRGGSFLTFGDMWSFTLTAGITGQF